MEKKILYFDMDNVLVDFASALELPEVKDVMPEFEIKDENGKVVDKHYDDIPDIFSKMKPMEGAVEAVRTLSEKYDVYILSTAPWDNPTAWSDKLEWVKRVFDSGKKDGVFYKRLILTHHKDLCIQPGAYLVDDRPHKCGAYKFGKNLIYLEPKSGEFKDWPSVVAYLMDKE